jgi:hypothetical protein
VPFLDGATSRPAAYLEVAGLSVRSYGALGDGSTNDYGAFAACTTAAIAAGVPVVIPPGEYILGTRWQGDGLKGIIGFGPSSHISASHTVSGIVEILNVTGGVYRDFKISGVAATRDSDNVGFYTQACDNILISGLEVSDCQSAGIYNFGITNSRITDCYVHDTYADGIHVTNASSDVTISGCTLVDTGDDSIACVDYLIHDAYVDGVTITGNTVRGSGARGITNIGASNVTITGNVITTTVAQGILVSEDGSYGTRVPEHTVVSGNTVRAAGSQGIEVETDGTNEAFAVVSNNIIIAPVSRGINIAAPCVDVLNNRVVEAGSIGIHVADSDNSSVDGNHVIRAVNQAIVVTGAVGTHTKNISMNLNSAYDCNTASTAGVDSFFARYVDGLTCVGNRASDPNGQTDRAFELIDCIGIRYAANMSITETASVFTNSTDVRRDFSAGTIPTVSGSKGANAALTDLIDELEALGMITDSTS